MPDRWRTSETSGPPERVVTTGDPARPEGTAQTGYLHPGYARSLDEFGAPRELPHSGSWILEQAIPGSCYRDARGCYPLFCCVDWSELALDMAQLPDDLVTLSLVTDPFGDYDERRLRSWFPDLVLPYKQHFVVDLSRRPGSYVTAHHLRNVRKGLRNVHVSTCEQPAAFVDDWIRLYSALIERHRITGLAAFSPSACAHQLRVPGIVAFRAAAGEATVGMLLWYVQGRVAYYHLGAYSTLGYELRASFALFWTAIEYFGAAGLQWLDLGGSAGLQDVADAGLARFKQGWATGTRTAYLCGRVFNQTRYAALVAATGAGTTSFFPAYRAG